MSLARIYPVIFLSLLVASCAQVGTISGGPKDEIAPQPKLLKANPPNETTNFSSKEIEIPFDEYITLNSPSENIRIVPPHAKLKSSMKKKSLIISWEEDLSPNTTYAIYINNAVKDITEGNDTIIQYVFSTGPVLDSINYNITVIDAWTNLPVDHCVVGLFDPNTKEIVNFTETGTNGNALLNYIHPNQYELIAFIDENKDLTVQEHEKVGFPINPVIDLESSTIDTIPVRLFSPLTKAKIRTSKYLAPNSIIIGCTRPVKNETVYLNGNPLSKSRYSFFAEDSLRVFLPPSEELNNTIVITSVEINDTTSVRSSISKTAPKIVVSSIKSNNTLAPSDTIAFLLNSYISSIDTSLIALFNRKDSVYIHGYSYTFSHNKLVFDLEKSKYEGLEFHFKKGAVISEGGSSEEQKINYIFNGEKNYGALKLNLSYYTTPILLQIYLNSKPIDLISPDQAVIVVNELEPGDYSFKIILDENQNGKWDTGNFKTYSQAEKVDLYSTPIKVRANWEVEATLIPNK